MSTFAPNPDDYSVEEISYDDMILILETQGQKNTDSHSERLENSLQSTQMKSGGDSQISRESEVSRRIAENANQPLAGWLINH